MNTLLNTLYVTTPEAYLRLDGETVVVEVEKTKRLQVPLHHLGGLVVFGSAGVSPALMMRFAEDGRAVVFCDRNGRFKARLEGEQGGNVLLRQAQYEAQRDVGASLTLARAFIAGKVKNTRTTLLRGGRDSKSPDESEQLKHAAELLAHILQKLPQALDHDTARGLEGDAARIYFAHFTLLIKPSQREVFRLDTRNRRPPRDPINALLSFCYALLMTEVRSGLESVGLDPQFGFLHALRPGRAALALDVMEEFRPVLADRLALTLVNREQLDKSGFDFRPGDTVLLNDIARKTVLVAWQDRKKETLAHPLLEQEVALGLLPHLQARLLARTLRGDLSAYPPFLIK